MATPVCSLHPTVAATHRCEGCERLLCPDCVQPSHVLLLCRSCGERALPLSDAGSSTVLEQKTRAAIAKPYALSEAFSYPFRGLGRYMFGATLISMAFVSFFLVVGWGPYPYLVAGLFGSLVIALQFKIADTSARGEVELPDWPEYLAFRDRLFDLLAYGFLAFLQLAPLVTYFYLFGGIGKVFTREPDFVFWLGFAIFAWAGAAFWVAAFGAAGHYGRGCALRIDLHLKALAGAKRDSLVFANIVFPLGIAVLLTRALFEQLPIVGAAVSGTLGAYWVFVSAHLAGLFVRRNLRHCDSVYG